MGAPNGVGIGQGGPLGMFMGDGGMGGHNMGGGRQGQDMDFRGKGGEGSFGMMGMPMSDGSTYKASHRDRPLGNPNAWSSSGPVGESRSRGGGGGGGFRGGPSGGPRGGSGGGPRGGTWSNKA